MKVSGGLASLSAAFPVISEFALPAAAGLAALSSVAASFGFTREAMPKEPRTTMRRLTSSLAQVDGVDTGEVVGLLSSNATTIDPSPGGGTLVDQISFASLFERWTIIDVFDVTDTSSNVLFRVAVTPFYAASTLGVRYHTVAGYVGLPFNFWRGDMEYLIYIPSSSNFQGSLQVCWDPKPSNVGFFPSDPTHRLSNVMISLNGSSQTILRVSPSLETPAFESYPLVQANLPTDRTRANGQLVFYVNTPLTGPKAGPYSVRVVIMARAGANMKFGAPRNFINTPASIGPLSTKLTFQAGQLGRTSGVGEVREMNASLVDGEEYPVCEVLFGEDIESVRALCQKFSPYYETTPPAGSVVWVCSHLPPPPKTYVTVPPFRYTNANILAPTVMQWTYLAYYAMLFVGVRGSTRLKQFGRAADVTIIAFPLPLFDPSFFAMSINSNLGSVIAGRPLVTHFDQQDCVAANGAEWTMPYYYNKKFLRPRYAPNLANINQVDARADALGVFYTTVGAGNNGYVAVAGGSDFTATRFRRVPGLLGF